ncbi:MAG: glycosyltransferase family 2 protein [Halanaerobiaceae bacterium]
MTDIGALVLTYNEEDNIRECLDSLEGVKRVVLVDSGSEDKTAEIARELGADVYHRELDDFSRQRNFGLDKLDTDWVLVVDADERVTSELWQEIRETLASPGCDAYRIPRRNYFLGKWIKHCGWYPDYTLRLFRNRELRFRGKVHEKIVFQGKTGTLENPLLHYTYESIGEYVSKMNHYTDLMAREKAEKAENIGLAYVIFRPVFELLKKLILQKGFLLGSQGLILSILSSYYKFLEYIKLWEKQNNIDGG